MFILPINRDVRPTRRPVVVITIMTVNVAIYLAMLLHGNPRGLISQFGFVPAHLTVSTLFSSMFVHSGFMHLLGNMWFFWMFGPQVEDRFGRFRFAVAYVLCGLGGAGLHTALNPHSIIPCVGASGAISGVAGTFFILFPKSPFELVFYFGYWRVKSFLTKTHAAIGAWIGEQTLFGLLSTAMNVLSIAFWAHIGGFVVGAVAGILFRQMVPLETLAYTPVVAETEESGPYEPQDSGITRLKL